MSTERKELEKLAKEVAGHDDMRKAAVEALALKIGKLEKETAEKISKLKKDHEASMNKLSATAKELEAQTLANRAKEKNNAGMSKDFAAQEASVAADFQAIRSAVEEEFAPRKTTLAATIEGLRQHEKPAHQEVRGKLQEALKRLEDQAGTPYEDLLQIHFASKKKHPGCQSQNVRGRLCMCRAQPDIWPRRRRSRRHASGRVGRQHYMGGVVRACPMVSSLMWVQVQSNQ